MTTLGCDYAFDRPDIGALVRQGIKFACRYGGVGGQGKWIDATEAKALSAAGISIVANAEGAADGLRGGFTAGSQWARSADQYFRSIGMPGDRPIYFSADWDVRDDQLPSVAQALLGAASVIGRARVGVYGGFKVVKYAHDLDVARWLWQTYAWSAGVWHPAANIRQYHNGFTLGGASIDFDEAMTVDFGQWSTNQPEDTMNEEQERLLRNVEYLLNVLMFGLKYDPMRLDWGHGEGVDVPATLNLALSTLHVTGSISGTVSGSLSGGGTVAASLPQTGSA